MSLLLPPTIAIKTGWSASVQFYLNYFDNRDENPARGFIRFDGTNLFSPLAKFEVLQANTGIGLVHIRCCHNKKFLRSRFETNGNLSPEADEPEEDQSKWSCTLFEPRLVQGNPDRIRLFHVQRQLYAHVNLQHWNFWVGLEETVLSDRLEIIDLARVVVLPRHVSFKGHNGKYLGTRVVDSVRYLVFDYDAKGRPETWFEVFTDGHGNSQIMSHYTGEFWRNANTWILSDVSSAADLTATSNFWPVKVRGDTIALKSSSSDRFCSLMALDSTRDGLSALHQSITPESHLVMEELVLERFVYNADFDLANAVIYGETPVTMATANATNSTDSENTIEFKFVYTESRSSTWSTSHSWMVGMSVSMSFRVPFIGGTDVSTTAEYSGTHEWGETVTTENTLETTYSVVVLPRTSISVSLVATRGNCDVPYSYFQRDVLYNGKTVVYKKDDGLYTGINSYNFHYEVTTLTQGRSGTPITLEQKLPNPLTDPTVEIPLPLPSTSKKENAAQAPLEETSEEISWKSYLYQQKLESSKN